MGDNLARATHSNNAFEQHIPRQNRVSRASQIYEICDVLDATLCISIIHEAVFAPFAVLFHSRIDLLAEQAAVVMIQKLHQIPSNQVRVSSSGTGATVQPHACSRVVDTVKLRFR